MKTFYHSGNTIILEELVDYLMRLKTIKSSVGDINRKIILTEVKNAYETAGTVVISIEGTPPKGYAVYIPELHTIKFFGYNFKPLAVMYDIVLDYGRKSKG